MNIIVKMTEQEYDEFRAYLKQKDAESIENLKKIIKNVKALESKTNGYRENRQERKMRNREAIKNNSNKLDELKAELGIEMTFQGD